MSKYSSFDLTIISLRAQGLSQTAIGVRLGIPQWAVSERLSVSGQHGHWYGFLDVLTDAQEAVLNGTLMGDAHLNHAGRASLNARLELTHSTKQLQYLRWKIDILKSLFKVTEPRVFKTSNGYTACRVTSRHHPLLTMFHRRFYPDGRKHISDALLEQFTSHPCLALLLATWYMDDGGLQGKSATFALGGLSASEYPRIRDWFERIGFSGHLQVLHNTNCQVLRFPVVKSRDFFDLIQPCMPQCMRYKIRS